MRRLVGMISVCLACLASGANGLEQARVVADDSISSRVEKTLAGELVLIQEVRLAAPVEKVWDAYATGDGWMGWAVPKAEVDLRVGGTILTQYDTTAEIGDPGTNTLHIVNYVPRRLMTLRAEIGENWPQIMKEDAENLTNVILFESTSPDSTRILSFGIGYRQAPEYDQLMQFFVSANEKLLANLKRYVEQGVRSGGSKM